MVFFFFLAHSELCHHHHNLILEYFHHPPKGTFYPLIDTPIPLPFPLPSSPRQPLMYFHFYGFAYSGHFTEMGSHNRWSFVASFFHLVECFQVHSCHVYHYFFPFDWTPLFGTGWGWGSGTVPLIQGQLGHSPSLTAQPPRAPCSSRSPPTCIPWGGWRPRGLLASYNWSTQPSRVCQLTKRQHPGADRHNLSKNRGGDWTQREAEEHSRSWAQQGL